MSVLSTGVNHKKRVAIIVAHPDDEILWAGGTVLLNPSWTVFILTLCRASDKDRSARFHRVIELLKVQGTMADLDDGPDQQPLACDDIYDAIVSNLPKYEFDLVMTHSPFGEYTRHKRHEETGIAVMNLWRARTIRMKELLLFAYSDNDRKHVPHAISDAPVFRTLPQRIWQKKYSLITNTYGFDSRSWEARTTPREEAFWCFTAPSKALQWYNNKIMTNTGK